MLKNQSSISIQQQGENLLNRLQNTQALTPILRDKKSSAIQQQRESWRQRLRDAQARAPILNERLKRRQDLLKQGAIASDQVLEAEQEYTESLQNISEIQAQFKQLDVDEAQAEQTYLDNLSKISEIQVQLKQLDVEKTDRHLPIIHNGKLRENDFFVENRYEPKLGEQPQAKAAI